MKTKIKGKLLGTCLPLAVAYAIHLAPYPYAICALYAYLSIARCLSVCVPHPHAHTPTRRPKIVLLAIFVSSHAWLKVGELFAAPHDSREILWQFPHLFCAV